MNRDKKEGRGCSKPRPSWLGFYNIHHRPNESCSAAVEMAFFTEEALLPLRTARFATQTFAAPTT